MPCAEHSGELTFKAPFYLPGARPSDALVELIVCDKCGVLFIPPERLQSVKAREAELMLQANTVSERLRGLRSK